MVEELQLDDDQARYVDALVQSGRYAQPRDVVRAGIEALRERDESMERWVRDDVVPVAKAMMADPSRAIPIEEVFDAIETRHAARVAAGARDA